MFDLASIIRRDSASLAKSAPATVTSRQQQTQAAEGQKRLSPPSQSGTESQIGRFDRPAFVGGGMLAGLFDRGAGGADKLKQVNDGIAAGEQMRNAAAVGAKVDAEMSQAMDAMGKDLNRLLKIMGVDDRQAEQARQEFIDRFAPSKEADRKESSAKTQGGEETGQKDLAVPTAAPEPAPDQAARVGAVSTESSSSQASLEVRDIQMTLELGGRKLSLHYESASLNVVSDSNSMQAAVASDGQGGTQAVVQGEQNHSTLKMASSGLDVQLDGASPAEAEALKKALPGLFDALNADSGWNGGVSVRLPEGRSDSGKQASPARKPQGAISGGGTDQPPSELKLLLNFAMPFLAPGNGVQADKGAGPGPGPTMRGVNLRV